MKRSSGPHRIANLSESIRQQLSVYALAAVVSLLALTKPSEASIVYTPVNVTISGNGSITLHLKNGTSEFTIQGVERTLGCIPPPFGGVRIAFVSVTPTTGNGVVANDPNTNDALALSQGAKIGPDAFFARYFGVMNHESIPWGSPTTCYPHPHASYSGYWCDGADGKPCYTVDGYLGLEFMINGKLHYGWAHVIITPIYMPRSVYFKVFVKDYAYETIPGQAINAGQRSGNADDPTVSPDSANPEDSGQGASVSSPAQAESLGTPALGAQDSSLWLREKPVGTASEKQLVSHSMPRLASDKTGCSVHTVVAVLLEPLSNRR